MPDPTPRNETMHKNGIIIVDHFHAAFQVNPNGSHLRGLTCSKAG
jgi:hypothetical protein